MQSTSCSGKGGRQVCRSRVGSRGNEASGYYKWSLFNQNKKQESARTAEHEHELPFCLTTRPCGRADCAAFLRKREIPDGKSLLSRT
ncbi:hypothetical protein F751_4032 [Auxenochlorella protothecoides]|uniref:Uncharacterized protein n=1 Tax=Auxenochlorella protothecoides TaxID=3075 RepID=A0A087SE53_AUXPR|nr:hypothetical protein F751_4032 [Auxenochlorella protothecoides]KFM24007.1 hypothetical protein F751_4032 [Auxenochlorella protothecoides]